jgi:hypothetical protein
MCAVPQPPCCVGRAWLDRALPRRAIVSLSRVLIVICVAVVMLLAPGATALAMQDAPMPKSEIERRGVAKITRSERDIRNGRPGIAGIQFGWNGEMPSERWGLIRVWIDGGRSGFSGALVISFRQDTSQDANIITPASGTPGRVLPVEVLALLPRGVNALDVSLISDRGRVVAAERFTRNGGMTPTGVSTQGLASLIGPTPGLVLIVQGTRADAGMPASIIEPYSPQVTSTYNPSKLTEPERVQERWKELRATAVTVEELSTAWAAYDGVEMLIVRDRDVDDVNPLARAAIHEWTLRGGRLVVIVERPDSSYRRWLPDVPDADAASLGEMDTFATPAAFAEDLKRQRVRHTERQAANHNAEDRNEEPESAWALSKSLRARPITISPRGLKRGWRAALPAETDSAKHTGEPTPSQAWTDSGPGLVASGPVGFGFVTIVALDPRDASATKSSAAAPAAWRRVLAEAAQPWLAGTPRRDVFTWGDFVVWSSGSSPGERAAIARASNHAAESIDVGDLSAWAFGGLAAIMLALGFLLGPIDAIVLKRLRARHRAWVTALAWIGLASVVAGIAPTILRGSQPSRLARFETIDLLQESSAAPGIARGPNPTIAFAAGITGLFSGPSGQTVLEGVDDAAWWRGISSRTTFGGMGGTGALAPLMADQRSITRDGVVVRGSPIRDTVQGQWMFRTLCDAGPPSFVPRVELRGPENAKKITVIGMPDGANIVRSALMLGTRRLFLKWEPHAAGDTVRRAEAGSELEPAEVGFWEFVPPVGEENWWSPPEITGQLSGADMFQLPGAAPRRWSIDTRLARGDYAMLMLEVTGVPPGVRIQGAPAPVGSMILRIVMPVND